MIDEKMDQVRGWLLSQGRHCRVLMKDAMRTKSLIVHLAKAEGGGQMQIQLGVQRRGTAKRQSEGAATSRLHWRVNSY